MNGVFAIEKPAGVSSAQFLTKVQRVLQTSTIFAGEIEALKKQVVRENYHRLKNKDKIPFKVSNKAKIKMGHGGTLDLEASGVLVVGIGSGTKRLQGYLTECVKSYKADAILGQSTTSGDLEGEVLSINPVDRVMKHEVMELPEKFVGHLVQTPPIFSAIKMNGKPLYEYARNKEPLPASIKTREIVVHSMTIDDATALSRDHGYRLKKLELDTDGESLASKLAAISNINADKLHFSKEFTDKLAAEGKEVQIPTVSPSNKELESAYYSADYVPPMVTVECKVSSGTYIRSLISDMGKALGTSAVMVKLQRTSQGEWQLGKNVFKWEYFEKYPDTVWGPVLKRLWTQGADIDVEGELEKLHYEYLKEHPEDKDRKYEVRTDEALFLKIEDVEKYKPAESGKEKPGRVNKPRKN